SLVLRVRVAGGLGAVAVGGASPVGRAVAVARGQEPMGGRALAAAVSTKKPYVHCEVGRTRIAVVDYGCKRSILRRLVGAGAAVTVYPHDVDADELLQYDSVLLSNGPGDPEPLADEIGTIRRLLGRVPILPIFLP